MIDLIQLGEKTYCIKNPINVGIYVLDDNNVCLIDTGNSRQFGKLIENILIKNNWNLKFIINTHSHADHIGGNKYLQEKYHCKIYANELESNMINNPELEPSFLYGASPLKDLYNNVLFAERSVCENIKKLKVSGLKIIDLAGHSMGLIGIVTSDNICFLGDAFTSEKILKKYAFQYIFDIDRYLEALKFLGKANYRVYVPAHGEIEEKIEKTIKINEETVYKNLETIYSLIPDEVSWQDLVKKIFDNYRISVNITQYYLIGATIKSYITKLINDKKIIFYFSENILMLKRN